MRAGLFLLLFLYALLARAVETVNMYNWSDYVPDDVLSQFEKETGIKVNYSTYDSNETMYAKLKSAPNAGYDIVVPTTYFVDRMRRQGMLQKIDKTKLSNFKNLNPALLNKPYDPHNNYSIPYLWGATGIVINDHYPSKDTVARWSDLWDSKLKNQLLLLDDTREIFSIALLVLGYSVNDTNPEHIKAAYQKLKQLLPNVKLFNGEAVKNIYIDEDATIGMGWAGDIFLARQENPHIQYVYPKEGFVVFADNIVIVKNAPHLENAYKFINFILRPEIAKKISAKVGFATPNLAAYRMLLQEGLTNPIIYPDEETLKRAQFQTDVGSAAAIYEKYLELLKIGA